MNKITTQWLKEQGACTDGVDWFSKQKTQSVSVLLRKAIAQKQFDFANWGITRLMSHQQAVQYACFSALQSLSVFEKAYPMDKRPRKAILAALRWTSDPSEVNKSAARSAESAARKKILLYGLKIVTKELIVKSVDHFLVGK